MSTGATYGPRPPAPPTRWSLYARHRQHVRQILDEVARYYELEVNDLLSPNRERHVTVPRQVAMWLARERTGLSLPQIGSVFGRDHTTALHSIRKVAADIQAYPEAARHVAAIDERLTALQQVTPVHPPPPASSARAHHSIVGAAVTHRRPPPMGPELQP